MHNARTRDNGHVTTDSRHGDVPTRERVLAATLQLVAERGLAGTSVVDIETAAGLAGGRGGFYRHFPNKEAALDEAIHRELDTLRARFKADRAAPNLTEELTQGVRGLQELGPLIALVLRGVDLDPETMRAFRTVVASGSATHGLDNVIRESVNAGRDPKAAAVVVTMATLGFHLAGEFLDGDVYGITESDFVEALAAMVNGT